MFEVRYDYMVKDNGGVVVEEYRSEYFGSDDGEAMVNFLDELDEDPTVFCVEALEDGVQTYLNMKPKEAVERYVSNLY